ncbi:MAG: hypothetical protein OES18_21385, partial [Deltaproteobacteria bacterium]|nr:hypothetical protein [Deltaproteobacteria bacterium]
MAVEKRKPNPPNINTKPTIPFSYSTSRKKLWGKIKWLYWGTEYLRNKTRKLPIPLPNIHPIKELSFC